MTAARAMVTVRGRGSRLSKATQRRHLWPKKMALDLKALQDACCGSGAQERCLISCCGVKRHDSVVGEGGEWPTDLVRVRERV